MEIPLDAMQRTGKRVKIEQILACQAAHDFNINYHTLVKYEKKIGKNKTP